MCHCDCVSLPQIIVRGRQSHLLQRYTAECTTSPDGPTASRVIAETSTAWAAYVNKYIAKLPAEQTQEDDFATAEAAWKRIQTQAEDAEWHEAQKLADEKFTMHFASVATGYAGIQAAKDKQASGSPSATDLTALIEANRDALGLWLDKQVC